MTSHSLPTCYSTFHVYIIMLSLGQSENYFIDVSLKHLVPPFKDELKSFLKVEVANLTGIKLKPYTFNNHAVLPINEILTLSCILNLCKIQRWVAVEINYRLFLYFYWWITFFFWEEMQHGYYVVITLLTFIRICVFCIVFFYYSIDITSVSAKSLLYNVFLIFCLFCLFCYLSYFFLCVKHISISRILEQHETQKPNQVQYYNCIDLVSHESFYFCTEFSRPLWNTGDDSINKATG